MARKTVDASELGRAANDLRRLAEDMEDDMAEWASGPDTGNGFSEGFSNLVMREMRERIPINDNDTKPEQDSLANSIEFLNLGKYKGQVRADAPHARPLEAGTKNAPYPIPTDGIGVAWEPEDPSSWMARENPTDPDTGSWFFDEDTGKVVHTKVMHPGVDGEYYALETAEELGFGPAASSVDVAFRDSFTDNNFQRKS